MSSRKRTYLVCALFAALMSGLSCSTPEPRFDEDPDAVANVRKFSAAVNAGRRLSAEDSESLRKLYLAYPGEEKVSDVYSQSLLQRSDWESLEKFYLAKNKRTPLNEKDLRNLALVLHKNGKYEDSSRYLAPLMEKSPDDLELVGAMASAKFSLGRLKEAAGILDSKWDNILEAKRSDEITLRGIIYLRQRETEKAIETLSKALEIKPDDVSASYNLVKAYRRAGNNERASELLKEVDAAQKSLKKDTFEKSVTVTKVVQLEGAWKKKDFQKVIELSENLLQTSTEKSRRLVLYQYLFESYKALGMPEKAEQVRVKAQQLTKQ